MKLDRISKRKLPPETLAKAVTKVGNLLERARQTINPPPVAILEILMGGWVARCLSVAAEFGFADLLQSGEKSAGEIAEATQTNTDAVFRVMRALASVGIFSMNELGKFGLTPAGEWLCENNEKGSLRALARFYGVQGHMKAWQNLSYSVKHGKSAFEFANGKHAFEYLKDHPEESEIFNGAMVSFSTCTSDSIAKAYDFSRAKVICDVGGGHGLLLATLLKHYTHLHGLLFEINHVADGAQKFLDKAGVSKRSQVVAGNFFETIPPEADTYIIKNVLHDWNDADSLRILKNVRKSASADARLLIVEMVLPSGNEPHPGKLLDIEMLVITEGGRERSQKDFERLLQEAGFRLQRVVDTVVSPLCILEALPVS